MPVEEAGNMLWYVSFSLPLSLSIHDLRPSRFDAPPFGRMALAYYQATGDEPWVSKHYDVLKQWTSYLIDDGLVPAEQLSTDDFAGTLSNQTDLAVKAIVGIGTLLFLLQFLSLLAVETSRVSTLTSSMSFRSNGRARKADWSLHRFDPLPRRRGGVREGVDADGVDGRGRCPSCQAGLPGRRVLVGDSL